jgi:hypothetical protein
LSKWCRRCWSKPIINDALLQRCVLCRQRMRVRLHSLQQALVVILHLLLRNLMFAPHVCKLSIPSRTQSLQLLHSRRFLARLPEVKEDLVHLRAIASTFTPQRSRLLKRSLPHKVLLLHLQLLRFHLCF